MVYIKVHRFQNRLVTTEVVDVATRYIHYGSEICYRLDEPRVWDHRRVNSKRRSIKW